MTDPPQEPRRRPRPYPPGGGPPVDDDPAAVGRGEAPAAPADDPTAAPTAAPVAGPGSGRRAALLAPAAVIVVAAVGVAAVVLVRDGDSGRAKSGSSPSAGLSQAPIYSASDSATGTGRSSVAEVAARGIVLEYLDDVNARNEAAAGQLICGENYATWKKNADSAKGDMSYTVIDSTFRGAHVSAGGGLVVTYALTFDDGTSNNVAFSVVKQQSLKICGIARA
jgi:hypothetical protein